MKLLFVIDCLGSGGAQRQLVNLAIGLVNNNHSIDFFVYYPQINPFRNILKINGIRIYSSEKRNKIGLNVIIKLRKIIKRGRYDGILSFLDTPNFYAEIATLGPKHIPLVVSERSVYPTGKLPIRLRCLHQFHRLANFITVNSNHQKERMLVQKRQFPFYIYFIGRVRSYFISHQDFLVLQKLSVYWKKTMKILPKMVRI